MVLNLENTNNIKSHVFIIKEKPEYAITISEHEDGTIIVNLDNENVGEGMFWVYPKSTYEKIEKKVKRQIHKYIKEYEEEYG